MLPLMLISFKACCSSAFCSFSLRSDHGENATSLQVLAFCCTPENNRILNTHLCTSPQHLCVVAEHHAIDQVAMLLWLDAELLVPGVLTGIQLISPLNTDVKYCKGIQLRITERKTANMYILKAETRECLAVLVDKLLTG